MNNARRARLNEAIDLLNKAEHIISVALSQEQDSLDNMPENLESSERYELMESACEYLEDADNQVLEAVDSIISAMGG